MEILIVITSVIAGSIVGYLIGLIINRGEYK
jgi:hypothetical protein